MQSTRPLPFGNKSLASFVLLACLLGLSGCNGQLAGAGGDGNADDPAGNTAPKATEKTTRHTNRLAGETSPYLLLHAHNPVDWYPWGPAAFEKARKENKPIFLSIGYSSCYWCHVMERLVFEDEEIADYMNQHFVNVKVDREERPDVDDIYMTALQVYFQLIRSPQGGGWPLSMFLTPEGKPIAGGTYFPPEDEGGRLGFPTVIRTVVDKWENQQKEMIDNADIITREVQRVMKPRLALKTTGLEPKLFDQAVAAVVETYDPEHGGVDFNPDAPERPKFPVPVKLGLLQHAIRQGAGAQTEKVVEHSLLSMAAGGIRDHLGGGFHRYSTDREWLVPHFEKMLYDQAQLCDVYLRAYQRTGRVEFRAPAEGILAFVAREMTDPEGGGFYSALDAETDGVEGQYYVWERDEVRRLLGGDADLFGRVYGLDGPRSFEHGYVLHLTRPLDEFAEELKTTPGLLRERLSGMKERLLTARRGRKPLLRDDKILTSWNGLMIRALANASIVLDDPRYAHAAEKAALFVLSKMRDDRGRLLRTYRAGQAKLNAYLDDYAFLVGGLLALDKATGDEKWLNAAVRLTDQQIELFWDEKGAGFFFTAHHHEDLLVRTKNANDSVIPSGNSASVRNLLRLAERTGEDRYRQFAKDTLQLFAGEVANRPRGLANMAMAVSEFLASDASGDGSGQSDASPDDGVQNALIEVEVDDAEETDDADGVQLAAGETAGSDDDKKKSRLVTARAFLSVDKLPAGGTCRIAFVLNIKEGWHINTNPPKPDTLIPTTVSNKSTQGVQLTVKYPRGTKRTVPGFEEPFEFYEKKVTILGTLKVPATAQGTDLMELQIRYQPCSDQTCLARKTITLKGRVPIGAPGEPVKQINQHLFPQRAGKTP